MLRQVCLLMLLLSVIAAVARTPEQPYPVGYRQPYIVIDRCQRSKSPSQQRRLQIGAGPIATLEEHPSIPAAITDNPEYTIFHRREQCPEGYRCIKERCRKLVRCADGYVGKRGRCLKVRKLGEQRRKQPTTALTQTTLEQETFGTSTTTPGPTGTIVYFPTRCRDGFVMVGGRCRRMWTYGQQSWMTTSFTTTTSTSAPLVEEGEDTEGTRTTMMYFPNRCPDGYVMAGGGCRKVWAHAHQRRMTTVPEPVPTMNSNHESTAMDRTEPTIIDTPERCPDGFVKVGGRCRKMLNVREGRSTDPQSRAKSDKDVEAAVSDNNKRKPL